jgi:hypothetical protein
MVLLIWSLPHPHLALPVTVTSPWANVFVLRVRFLFELVVENKLLFKIIIRTQSYLFNKISWAGGVVQTVERLPRKCEAMSSNTGPQKINK